MRRELVAWGLAVGLGLLPARGYGSPTPADTPAAAGEARAGEAAELPASDEVAPGEAAELPASDEVAPDEAAELPAAEPRAPEAPAASGWRPPLHHLRMSTAFSDESTGFQRYTAASLSEFEPGPATRLRFQPLFDHFREDGGSLERYSLGLEAHQLLPGGLSGRLRYRLRVPDHVRPTHEFVGELSRDVWRSLAVRAGGRRRAIVDSPPAHEEVAYFEGMGSGGATLAAIRNRIQIAEGYIGTTFSPLAGSYAYGEAAFGSLSDGNDATTAVWGVGVDLLRHWLAEPTGHVLRLRYDSFYLAMDESRPDYFSPDDFNVHTPALEWSWVPFERAVVGASTGISLRAGRSPGWNLGGFGRLPIRGPLQLEARVYRSDDTEFQITSATLALLVALR